MTCCGDSEPRPIHGLQDILKNVGTLHHIHEPGEDGPDDPGASEFWEVTVQHAVTGDAFIKLSHAVRDELPEPPVQILTTRGVRARYAAMLERRGRLLAQLDATPSWRRAKRYRLRHKLGEPRLGIVWPWAFHRKQATKWRYRDWKHRNDPEWY